MSDERMSVDRYNVVWDTPSGDSSGSMPIGNGDIGLNVWMEDNGDLVFYLGKTDAWNENVRLLKLGRVRIRCFARPQPFCQTLHLDRGEIEIRCGAVRFRIWVDAHQPVVRVEAESDEAFDMHVALEMWRDRQRELTGKEIHSALGLDEGPEPIIESPDTILPIADHRIAWCHRNPTSAWAGTLTHQNLAEWMDRPEVNDPILNRTFGGAICGEGLVAENDTTLASAEPAHRFVVSMYALTCRTETDAQWLTELNGLIAKVNRNDLEQSRIDHRRWWSEFWNRSWIHITGDDNAENVSRCYALQRFINACGGRGAFPIKFNGSIFTVDPREPDCCYDGDYRYWGGAYWFQNTRLIYWPMLASGDWHLMPSFFDMYLQALPLAKYRTRKYFGHDGASFPEVMYFWGTYTNWGYGWDRTDKPIEYCQNTWIHHYWSGGLELVTMMLDYADFTGSEEFFRTVLLPLTREILLFYSQHYPRDEHGTLRLHPANALEMWHDSVNPMPDVAGLRFVLTRLLSLSELPTDLRDDWQQLAKELPEIPMTEVNGQRLLAPAQECIGPTMNFETPELYAIFPHRLYGIGKNDLELARRTFEHRGPRQNFGWQQHPIHAAMLGLAKEAQQMVVERFSTKHAGSRFPAFWGPNFDWVPDQDHGCVTMMALQCMLLQAEGDEIFLLPAWPTEWSVDFKLLAPKGRIVEGIYRDGVWIKKEVSDTSHAAVQTLSSESP